MVAMAGVCAASEAKAIDYRDILGAWCSVSAKIVFTRSAMSVTLFSTHRTTTEKITRFKFSESDVEVFWIRSKEEVSATYGEFSADRRVMVLQPDGSAPRREYRRC